MNFASDNVYGVHPKILAALNDANTLTAIPYGNDDWTRAAEEKLRVVFECELRAFLVATGSAANGLALSALTPGHGAILCHAEAHITSDECNGTEFFTGGAKIKGLAAPHGKLMPGILETALRGFVRGVHEAKPKAVSLTNATELGTVYKPDEVSAIAAAAKTHGLKLHMDGARLANALVSSSASPADLTWKAGIDVLSFGASKNGAMMADAVIFFDLALAEEFAYRRLRAGQTVSKSRYLAAQLLAYLEDDLWLDNARRANGLAHKLATAFATLPGVRLIAPVEANIIFAFLQMPLYERLRSAGAVILPRMLGAFAGQLAPGEIAVRMVTSCTTPAEHVDQLIELAQHA